MKFLNRDDNVLSLTHSSPGNMRFAYRSLQHALIFGLFAALVIAAVWFLREEIESVHTYLYWFTCAIAIALVFGTIRTSILRCTLDIEERARKVGYELSTMRGKQQWRRGFDEFKEVRLYRPIAGKGAGHSASSKVLLVASKGEEIPLGRSLLGTRSLREANAFAEELAALLGLSVVQES